MVKFWGEISLFKLNLQIIIQEVKYDKRVVVLRVYDIPYLGKFG